MRTRTLQYIIAEAGRGVKRNRNLSLVSVSTVAVCLVLLAIVLLLAVNLDHVAGDLESQVTIKVYLADGTTPEQVTGLKEAMGKVEGIKEITFVNKADALTELKSWINNDAIIEGLSDLNPLRESFRIRVQVPAQVMGVAESIKALPGVAEVDYRQGEVEKLFAVTNGLRLFGLAMIALLGAGTVFLVSNTIRITIFARRREIGIMKLVGATDWFIRWPFVVEGMLIGVFGAIVGLIAIWTGYYWLFGYTTRVMPFFGLMAPLGVLPGISLLVAAAGLLIGVLGSGLSVRRFLRV